LATKFILLANCCCGAGHDETVAGVAAAAAFCVSNLTICRVLSAVVLQLLLPSLRNNHFQFSYKHFVSFCGCSSSSSSSTVVAFTSLPQIVARCHCNYSPGIATAATQQQRAKTTQ